MIRNFRLTIALPLGWLPLPSRIFHCRPKTKKEIDPSHLGDLSDTLHGHLDEKIGGTPLPGTRVRRQRTAVAYPGGCIACACTPGGVRGAPKRRGEKERSKERERKKGKEKGRHRRREGKGKKICKRKGKEGRNQNKIGYKKKNTRVATRE